MIINTDYFYWLSKVMIKLLITFIFTRKVMNNNNKNVNLHNRFEKVKLTRFKRI